MTYADRSYWDGYFRVLREQGSDLDWGGEWTKPFLPLLLSSQVRNVLELGCGTGNDAARLARAGFEVTALDLSGEAVEQARARYAQAANFLVGDMAERLPFADESFDAVMANAALHMFSDTVTRSIFGDVRRVLRPLGLLLFHVNAHDDRPLRERRRPIARELEPDYVLEVAGQAVRFFSRGYVEELLSGWDVLRLDHVEIADQRTRQPFKRVWRVAARRLA